MCVAIYMDALKKPWCTFIFWMYAFMMYVHLFYVCSLYCLPICLYWFHILYTFAWYVDQSLLWFLSILTCIATQANRNLGYIIYYGVVYCLLFLWPLPLARDTKELRETTKRVIGASWEQDLLIVTATTVAQQDRLHDSCIYERRLKKN